MIKIEIYIEEFPKSNAASYFEYDSEKHHKMIKELRVQLLSVLEDDKNQRMKYESDNRKRGNYIDSENRIHYRE